MRIAAFAIALAACASAASAQNIAMREQAGMRWACGGVGVEERAALASLRPQANLELLFVTAKRGGYLADVEVSFHSADKGAPLLQLVAEGPMCMVLAPAGRYRIEASYGGVKRALQATAGGAGTKLARLVFAFPQEPWDGIRASEEEKQEAKAP